MKAFYPHEAKGCLAMQRERDFCLYSFRLEHMKGLQSGLESIHMLRGELLAASMVRNFPEQDG
jgi:hypothetical protein